ncbi:MAG: alpha-2-macroglobulin family protein, partial [Lysobacterales bacterium]
MGHSLWLSSADITRAQPAPDQALASTALPDTPIRLTAATPTESEPASSTPVLRPLSDAEVEAVLAGLPALPERASSEFAWPEDGPELPAAANGLTILGGGPVAPTVATQASPLRVLRYSPLGAVGEPTAVRVMFDRPMVPLGGLADRRSHPPPIRLRPEPPGQWRWLDPTTTEFQPQAGELPKATHFEVDVMPTAHALDGAKLESAVRWRFDTPALVLQQGFPDDRVDSGPDPIIVLRFNQRVEPDRLLRSLSLHAGDRRFRLRLAEAQQHLTGAEPGLTTLLKGTRPGHSIALRAVRPLPLNTDFELRLASGARSAEGPRRTTAPQVHRFSTYGPLRAELLCGKSSNPCAAETPIEILFSNTLAKMTSGQLKAWIGIEPPIDVGIRYWGNRVQLEGAWTGNSDYRIELSSEFRDVHGQHLPRSALQVSTTGGRPVFLVAPTPLLSLPPDSPHLPIPSRNLSTLQARVHAVQPADWPDFLTLFDRVRKGELVADRLPGRLLADVELSTNTSAAVTTSTELDFSPYGSVHPSGQFLILIRGNEPVPGALANGRTQFELRWVQVSDLALQAATDSRHVQVWATDQSTGAPIPNVRLELLGDPQTTVFTDANGLADVPLRQEDAPDLLIARRNEGITLLPHGHPWMRPDWTLHNERELRWHVVTDRDLYRPGERVHAKGWVREVGREHGQLQAVSDGSIHFEMANPDDGVAVVAGEIASSRGGNFDLSFDIPITTSLGWNTLVLRLEGHDEETLHGLRVEHYRRPEFELNLESPEHLITAGSSLAIKLQASYFSGGPLAASLVQWQATTRTGQHVPPGLEDWTVGDGVEAWEAMGYDEVALESLTDAQGRNELRLATAVASVPLPQEVELWAEVEDLNHQSVDAAVVLTVHPALAYVGMRSSADFVAVGQSLDIEFKTVDPTGRLLTDQPIELIAGMPEQDEDGDSDEFLLRHVQRCDLRSNHAGLASCRLRPSVAGPWILQATVRDQAGHSSLSRDRLWVNGGDWSEDAESEIALMPDQRLYEPGATARILLLTPIHQGHGLLRVHREQVLTELPFAVQDGQAIVELPLSPHWYPGVALHATVVGRDGADALPATAAGEGVLNIAPSMVRLQVDTRTPTPTAEPGSDVTIDLAVSDASGAAMADTELSLFVVDDAVYALTGERRVDPLMELHRASVPADAWLNLDDSRAIESTTPTDQIEAGLTRRALQIISNERGDWDDEVLTAVQVTGSRIQSQSVVPDSRRNSSATRLRKNFDPVAAFQPRLLTNAAGRVSATIRLPDNLTRYRVVAIASLDADRFGVGESAITARLPLMARPSPPRFLHAGDQLELPVLVQNQTDQPLQVHVAARTAGLILSGAHGYALTVPAQQRARVSFPALTTLPGQAELLFAVRSQSHSDASAHSLPVWTPASIERVARHGVVEDATLQQSLQVPGDVWPNQGGLKLDLSTTALQSLQDAYLYLQDYPYACSEQIASRLLATTTLGPLLEEFGRGPDAQAQRDAITSDIAILLERHSWNGFGLWQIDEQVLPYVSLHVVHALLRARSAGHLVPALDQDAMAALLTRIADGIPASYQPATRRHVQAYALDLQRLNGSPDVEAARALLAEMDPAEDIAA